MEILKKIKMGRAERFKAIREIIKAKRISSQEELMAELLKRGFKVTQSTVSRDINFLNLTKVRNYKQEEYYTLAGKYLQDPVFSMQKLKSKFKENVATVDMANNIIVIKTTPGEAQGVAAVIDGMNFDEIIGTVAGDDTIICIAKNNDSAEKIIKIFQEF